jgi:hypothetical protein
MAVRVFYALPQARKVSVMTLDGEILYFTSTATVTLTFLEVLIWVMKTSKKKTGMGKECGREEGRVEVRKEK